MAVISPPNYTLYDSSAGFDVAIVQTTTQVGAFLPMLLLFVWIIIFLGGVRGQTRRTGSAETPLWAALASMATFMLSLIFTLVIESNVMMSTILGITLGLTILTGVWAFMSSKD